MPKRKGKGALRQLVQKAIQGDRRAISQLMSLAENDPYARIEILSRLYWRADKAHIVGITGPPGCGKSTLIAELTKRLREKGLRVGIVAVDPSSQITGGALLGDRIRMGGLASDLGVFIRSMATRGYFGGISRATEDSIRILAASSMDYVIVETAGAGQSDVDVKKLVQTTVVVLAPGLGDEIQALKAGIMEIGDIFVVNKADRESADRTAQEIHSMISMAETPREGWRPRVLKTTATSGDGVVALSEAIKQHAEYLKRSSQQTKQRQRLRLDVLEATKRYFEDIQLEKVALSERFFKLISQVESRKIDPYTAARKVLRWTHSARAS